MPRRKPLTADFDAKVLGAALPRHVFAGHMRYRDFHLIAQGGKAEVFRCTDVILGREVALKVLHRRLMEQPIEQELLVREARVMAALRHAAIPPVHDLGRDPEGRPYYAMGLKPGVTLHEVLSGLRRGEPEVVRMYDLERLLGVLVHVAEALVYAHGMNVVHCDLKPENIIIDSHEAVSLIDWGLAIVDDYSDGAEDNPAVRRRGCQGSPLYMAPEQASGEPLLGPAVDIYGLGVLVYECLTLDTPCKGSNAAETLRNVRSCAPVPPRTVAPHRPITRDIQAACLRALAKAPEDRFASMAEFGQALRDCRTDLLIEFEREESAESPYGLWLGAWNEPYDSQRKTRRVALPDDEFFVV